MRGDFRHFEPVRVRWGDMDSMGHVNNAVYFTYCESARMSYFEAVDLPSHAAAPSHGPALAAADLNFRQQVRYPAELEVGARVTHLGGKSFTFEYVLFRRGSEEVVADGSGVIAWVDYEQGKAIPLPDSLRQAIRDYEGGRL